MVTTARRKPWQGLAPFEWRERNGTFYTVAPNGSEVDLTYLKEEPAPPRDGLEPAGWIMGVSRVNKAGRWQNRSTRLKTSDPAAVEQAKAEVRAFLERERR